MARFAGLKLSAADQKALKKLRSGRAKMSPRTWRRMRTLELLHAGNSVRGTALAVGGYPREVSRVGKRYLTLGLGGALSDDARPVPPKKLDSSQEAAVVAMVCGPPPEGMARWTVSLARAEAMARGIVDTVGRETIRALLARHDLKPWREKNVVRAKD